MITSYQRTLMAALQNAWLDLREEVAFIEDAKIKSKLLFHVDKCLDWTPLLYLSPLQNALEIIIHLIQLIGSHSSTFEKINHVKSLLDELNFTFTLQGKGAANEKQTTL